MHPCGALPSCTRARSSLMVTKGLSGHPPKRLPQDHHTQALLTAPTAAPFPRRWTQASNEISAVGGGVGWCHHEQVSGRGPCAFGVPRVAPPGCGSEVHTAARSGRPRAHMRPTFRKKPSHNAVAHAACRKSVEFDPNRTLSPSPARLFDPSSGLHIHWQTSTGVFACVSTLFVTLPIRSMESPLRPCDDITMRSQPLSSAAAMMA
jgi:hypothetical protein